MGVLSGALRARDQEIDDVVAHAVVERVLVEVGALALLGQRVLDDLGQHGVGAVGHQHDAVGEIDRLVDVVGDHEHGLPGGGADAAHLVLQGAARERIERGEGRRVG
jgi:hypothetical protein